MSNRILVVCAGNICRSPLAEGILTERARAAGLDLHVDSAAANGWHTGSPPDGRAVVAARLAGYDISDQRARPVVPRDFEQFDLILVMDLQNLHDIESLRPKGNTTRLELFTAFHKDGETQGAEIHDPYFSGKFNPVIKVLEESVEGLLDALRPEED